MFPPQLPNDQLLEGRFEVSTCIFYKPDGSVHTKVVKLLLAIPGKEPFEFELPPKDAHQMAETIHLMAYQVDSDATLVESFHKLGVSTQITSRATSLARLRRQAGSG